MDKDTDIKFHYIFCSDKYNFVWIDIPKVAPLRLGIFKKEVSDLQCTGVLGTVLIKFKCKILKKIKINILHFVLVEILGTDWFLFTK